MCTSLKTCCFRGWEHSTCWECCPDHGYVSEGYDPHRPGDTPGRAAGGPASHRAGSHAGETGICCGQAEDWDTAPTRQGYDWLQGSGGTCSWQPSSAIQLPQPGRVDQGGIAPINAPIKSIKPGGEWLWDHHHAHNQPGSWCLGKAAGMYLYWRC